MGLKLRRFRAKLKWQHKEFTPKVVCLRYHINSEFPETLFAELTNENNVSNSTTAKSTLTAEKDCTNLTEDTNETQTEPLPLKGILKKVNSYNGRRDINYYRTTNLEEGKRSPLIFITHDQNDDYNEEELENNNCQNTADEKPLCVTYATNDSSNDTKDLTDKTQIENCVSKSISFASTDSKDSQVDSDDEDTKDFTDKTQIENCVSKSISFASTDSKDSQVDSDDEDTKDLTDKTQTKNCVNNSINLTRTDSKDSQVESDDDSACEGDEAYSSQAASIFFAGKPPKPLPRIRNNVTSSTSE